MELRPAMLTTQTRQRFRRRRARPGEHAFLAASKALAKQEREVLVALRVLAVQHVQAPGVKALQFIDVRVLAEWAEEREHVENQRNLINSIYYGHTEWTTIPWRIGSA
jgi:hypothetical protein